ncbi:MAG: hypothetical protein QXU82_03065 [Candidatus Aenigmatarchaeota archaeon]
MATEIGACLLGAFALENGKVREAALFERDPKAVAERMRDHLAGRNIPEVERLMAKTGGARTAEADCFLRENMRRIALEKGLSQEELNKFIVSVFTEASKMRMTSSERRDKLIIQAVSALSDLDKILNLMSERLREWFGLHYPELNVSEHESFAKKVAQHGSREAMEGFTESMGIEFKEKDKAIIKAYADELVRTYGLKKALEDYLSKAVPEEMPNTNALLGSVLAAKVLALAGGIERLAKMPSSTLQLLGAEKALFKFLKEKKKGKPPKFGILFTHPDISTAPKEQQGKIARMLSSKVTIAVRTDFYSKEDRSKEMLEDYKAKIAGLRK